MSAPMTHLTISAASRTILEASGSSAFSWEKMPEKPGMMNAVAMKRNAIHMMSMMPGWIMLMMSFFFTSWLLATSLAAFSRLPIMALAVGAERMSSRTVRGKSLFSWRIACLKDAPSSRMALAAFLKVRPMVYLWNCSPTISRARASDSPTRRTMASDRTARATVSVLDFLPAPQTKVGPLAMGTAFASTSGLLFLSFLFGFVFVVGLVESGAVFLVNSAMVFPCRG